MIINVKYILEDFIYDFESQNDRLYWYFKNNIKIKYKAEIDEEGIYYIPNLDEFNKEFIEEIMDLNINFSIRLYKNKLAIFFRKEINYF